MHQPAMEEMTRIMDAWPYGTANVLDVGALDVNGNYRAMITQRGWTYTGLDICPGPNVDVVSENPYEYPFGDGTFDIVMSGCTLEHVKAIWFWMPELARLVRSGWMLAIITHTNFPYHAHPVDCWRVMPDGMRYLFDDTGLLCDYDIRMYCETDISGVAWRD